jgi:hypothetical protein
MSALSDPSCCVCFQPFTASMRKVVHCPYCVAKKNTQLACSQCHKTSLLQESLSLPTCMLCKSSWTEDIMRDLFSSHWYDKTYASILSTNLFLREKQFFADTLDKSRYERLQKTFMQHRPDNARVIQQIISSLSNLASPDSITDAVYQWKQLQLTLSDQFDRLAFYKGLDDDDMRIIETYGAKRATQIRASTIRIPCPVEDCRGMLSTNMKCMSCDTKACKECFAVLSDDSPEEHKCCQDDLESAKLIQKECKLCPNPSCHVPIFKIEGCRQMFCTKCKTCFDWTSLEILKGNIHNPHYFDWLATRQNETETSQPVVNQGRCEVDVGITDEVVVYFQQMKRNGVDQFAFFYSFALAARQIRDLPNYLHPNPRGHDVMETMNYEARKEYLSHNISEEDFKRICLRNHRALNKNKDLAAISDMLYMAASNLLHDIPQRDIPSAPLTDKKEQCIRLIRYYNASLVKMCEKYNSRATMTFITSKGTIQWYKVKDINKSDIPI